MKIFGFSNAVSESLVFLAICDDHLNDCTEGRSGEQLFSSSPAAPAARCRYIPTWRILSYGRYLHHLRSIKRPFMASS